MSQAIQWFPGHIAKQIREFAKISKQIDVFFVLVDARAINSTYLSNFDNLLSNKKKILIITKADLVNKDLLSKWVNEYKGKFDDYLITNFKKLSTFKTEITKKLNGLNIRSLIVKVAFLGVPNVGKSTLVNQLTNKKSSKVEDRAGVTRKSLWFIFNKKYWILDSPGVLEPKFDSKEQIIKLALIGSIRLEAISLNEVIEFLENKLNKKFVVKNKQDMIEIIKDFQKNNKEKIFLD